MITFVKDHPVTLLIFLAAALLLIDNAYQAFKERKKRK